MTVDPLERLAQICRVREPRRRDDSIVTLVGSIKASSAKSHRKLGKFIELWLESVPEDLALQTQILGLRAGTVQIGVSNASAKYELDRRLRSGLFKELQSRYPGTLARVKLHLDSG